ncbi:hypothetical protein [Polynucleobacter sp. AP-Ainpum-60-G11]|uniref:hypothetical protein n=1 Tax=Polynucleobacter sp. AP-Ainpum-60-G11 TaxID=2576926 RepID=UPI001BFD4E4B|nr:hypothetical protein [Polynucleobacter sp. AP-Ainpum-60-G11]QWE27495.1 hypothetical protein FD971_04305 [Polynucleobacter sp. AP-Ainpum-60-G11]
MKISHSLRITTFSFIISLLSACTVDKLEARLQADPECKPVMNAKTGALMPCPGSDRQFYKSIPALNAAAPKVKQGQEVQMPNAAASSVSDSASKPASVSKATSAPVECKPQLHQKSGSLMPCPGP